MTITTIENGIARKVTVVKHTYGNANLHVKDTNLHVKDTNLAKEIYTALDQAESEKIGLALLGENATVVTDLPEVKRDVDGWVFSGSNGAWETATPEKILKNAKELLAVHAFLVKRNAEQEEAKRAEEEAKKAEAEAAKAKEAARNKRRDELAQEFRGCGDYAGSSRIFQKSIDRIIDLEEAAKVS